MSCPDAGVIQVENDTGKISSKTMNSFFMGMV
jgi:hypothetical protein